MIDTWTNPWTGNGIDVTHVANDPVNSRSIRWERSKDRHPRAEMGSRPGLKTFDAAGFCTFDKSLIPAELAAILDVHYPLVVDAATTV